MAKKPPKPVPPDAAEASLSYEQAVEQLEEIVERIESGEIGLGDSIAQYERGVRLIARCRAVLDQAEQKIAELDLSSAPPDRAD